MSDYDTFGALNRPSIYRASSKERIEIGYVTHAEADSVVEWLRANSPKPEQGIYGDFWRTPEPRTLLEYVLLRRKEALIDYGLAAYGRDTKVIQRVYNRGNVATRLAALANPFGSVHIKQARDIFRTGKATDLAAIFSNPFLHGGLLENLFERKEIFSDIDDERFATLIYHAAGHPRLSREYTSLYMDGYDEYSYHRIFSAAWELTGTVPANRQWAILLERLLGRCQPPVSFTNVDDALARWKIDASPKDGGQWFDRGMGFHLRVLIASTIREDKVLSDSEDPALRMAFYKRFQPYDYRRWTDFFDKDGAEFVHYALENENLWRSKDNRDALKQLCWRCPDPHHNMDYPNEYRATEKRMEESHPDWFKETAADIAHDAAAPENTLREIKSLLEDALRRFSAMSAQKPRSAGWWVAGILFVYILLR